MTRQAMIAVTELPVKTTATLLHASPGQYHSIFLQSRNLAPAAVVNIDDIGRLIEFLEETVA